MKNKGPSPFKKTIPVIYYQLNNMIKGCLCTKFNVNKFLYMFKNDCIGVAKNKKNSYIFVYIYLYIYCIN